MADAPAYMIANLHIHDADKYLPYEKGFFGLLKKHGGEFITFDDKIETFEGETPRSGRIVLFKFASAEAARAWYDDPEYQELSQHRRAGTNLQFLTMVHGMPTRE